jgi:hypothetical protein
MPRVLECTTNQETFTTMVRREMSRINYITSKSSNLVPQQLVSQKVEMIATFAKHKQKQRYFISSKWSNKDVGIQVV